MAPRSRNSNTDGLPKPLRLAGEPPERFPYDRQILGDCLAWAQASPNFYFGGDEKAYSRDRYTVIIDATMSDVPHEARVCVIKIEGAEALPEADQEDTDAVFAEYQRWRSRYRNLGLARMHVEGEYRPGPVTSVHNLHNVGKPNLSPVMPPGRRPPSTRL